MYPFLNEEGSVIDSRHLLISALLPPAVKAFLIDVDVDAEVARLCGTRYSHGSRALRWGSQPASIVLGRQRVAVERPRIRDRDGREVTVKTYARLQDPELFDEAVFSEGTKRVSQRDFEQDLPKIAASFGISKSAVSRSWIRTTQKQVEQLLSRDLGPLKIVAVYIDGRRSEKLGVVVALGVSEDGKKYVLGCIVDIPRSACLKDVRSRSPRSRTVFPYTAWSLGSLRPCRRGILTMRRGVSTIYCSAQAYWVPQ